MKKNIQLNDPCIAHQINRNWTVNEPSGKLSPFYGFSLPKDLLIADVVSLVHLLYKFLTMFFCRPAWSVFRYRRHRNPTTNIGRPCFPAKAPPTGRDNDRLTQLWCEYFEESISINSKMIPSILDWRSSGRFSVSRVVARICNSFDVHF